MNKFLDYKTYSKTLLKKLKILKEYKLYISLKQGMFMDHK
jgi:hypothetical protein